MSKQDGTTDVRHDVPELTGTLLDGKYHLLHKLGQGGMGTVYLAENELIGRLVAVKFLHSKYADNQEAVERFLREARAAAQLRHPNIIDVLDVGATADKQLYMVLEYLEGRGVDYLVKHQGPLDIASTCAILLPTLKALKAAHDNEVIHRDLKIENIFLSHNNDGSWSVKIIDFGVSKVRIPSGGVRLTQNGNVVGTPACMAPEQAKGKETDHRADLWSVGVALYEMLTGALPFAGEEHGEILLNVLTEEPISPYKRNPAFSAKAYAIIRKALEKNPAMRYQTAEEMSAALRTLAAEEKSIALLSTLLREGAPRAPMGVSSLPRTADHQPLDPKKSSQIPKALMERLASVPPPPPLLRRRRSGIRQFLRANMKIGLAISSVVAVILLALLIAAFQNDTSAQLPDSNTLPAAPATVRISVEGIPASSVLYLDGTRVSGNPFTVPKSASPGILRIESEGYLPFETKISPSSHKVISTSLRPAPAPRSKPAPTDATPPQPPAGVKPSSVKAKSADKPHRRNSPTSKRKSSRPLVEIIDAFE